MVARTELHRHYGPEKLLAIGQDLYRQQKYPEALEALTAALHASKAPETTLASRDRRAATYLKLDNLQAALKDGESMLREDKTHAKGYLRTGAVLEKKEQREIALKIYARGLKHVSSKDPLYSVIREQHTKLVMVLSPPKAADMLTMLPLELLDMVFSHIPFRDTCRCLRVSKHWNEFLSTAPFIWRQLDFRTIPARRSVNLQTVRKYMKWADHDVRSVRLKGVELQSSKLLKELAVKCKGLESLTVLSGGELRQSLMDCVSHARALRCLILEIPVHSDMAHHILNMATNLETVSFGEITRPQSYTVHDPVGDWAHEDYPRLHSFLIRNWGVKALTALLPGLCPPASNLKIFYFSQLGHDTRGVHFKTNFSQIYANLEEITMKNVLPSSRPPIPLPLKIKAIAMIDCKGIRFDDTLDYRMLTHIVVHDTWGHEMQPHTFNSLIECSTNEAEPPAPLEVLDLSVASWSKADVLALITANRLARLRCLCLQGCQVFDDDLAGVIAGTLKQLSELSINATKVTGVGVKKLVQSLANLSRLNVSDCEELGQDAVDWARKQGVKVGASRSL